MIERARAVALGCLLSVTPALGAVAAEQVTPADEAAAEIRELRTALQVLQERLAALEAKAQQAEVKIVEAEATNDRQTDQLAMTRAAMGSWVGNFTWKGDLRYRDETIHQQYAADRNRDRLRMRAGFVAKVNDTVRVEMQLATGENGDPRSSNQTLSGVNSRKGIDLDLAYAEWKPVDSVTVTAGKMKYPWLRPGQSILFDGDINPEGVAIAWNGGGPFASAFHLGLKENSSVSESTLTGAQAGYRWQLDSDRRLVLAASHFRFNNLRGQNVFWEGGNASFGNTLVNGTVGDECFSAAYNAATGRLCYEYRLTEALAEYTTLLAERPFSVHADYIRNSAAANGLDIAWSAGANWGKASEPGSWEMGAFWQHIEKDALFAQFIDSDFGAGNTDADGLVVKAAYAPARNWTLNATWFLNETNLDRPVTVSGRGAVYDRDYRRLQLDLNFKF